LLIGIPSGASTELDCGDPNTGLVYCRRNGSTGTVFQPVPPSAQPRFPSCCDPDNDGFGTLVPPPNVPPNSGAGAMSLVHGARTDQIKTGDQLIKHVNDANGVEIATFTATVQYLFVTVPALFSYDDDGPGGRAPTVLSYPYSPDVAHEFPISARPAGDPSAGHVVVTLTFWRPQRRRIAGDPAPQAGDSATWTDIGGLSYGVNLGPTGGGGFPATCPQGAFSEDDPNLGPVSGGGFIGFTDSRQPADQPANPANKLTFTVNLSQCDPSWNTGETRFLELSASSPNGRGVAQQALIFKRQ
jgi:hypothetical protein